MRNTKRAANAAVAKATSASISSRQNHAGAISIRVRRAATKAPTRRTATASHVAGGSATRRPPSSLWRRGSTVSAEQPHAQFVSASSLRCRPGDRCALSEVR